MTLGFAILGAGRIGQAHARAISATAGARFVALSEPLQAAADDMQARYGCDLRSIDEIAASDDIDAVAICTPTDTHADLIEQFAKAGKAIFCEKPVDLSADRVRQALDTVAQTNAKLMVGFNRRFDPDFMSVKAAIDAGQVGDVEMVVITSRDPGPPPAAYIKVSGGIFRDMTIHDFDMARWLLGEEVTSVMAQGSVLVAPEIGELGDFDSVNVILKTASGKQAVITNSRRATYGYDQRIEVHGSKGMVAAANRHESTVEVAGGVGFTRPPLLNFFMDRYAVAYANEIAAFVAAVTGGGALPTTGQDGLRALELADAALESAQTGKAVTPG
ncbi:inositol 2-dehydrogenase [Antarctobacter heliothermus]|uniref:Myo-inositol 2-dehydrogenase n=1 Tax=Antarctobacter heliothermus TaxID=74033 RepID=A0A239IJ19_9RHOB|nr:inositol 2-dehydrogenase [Antarctobacter heliothermus]SNS93756.1 myo-inositol 2-dehydrogenase [Antarctobacter heliothermus]